MEISKGYKNVFEAFEQPDIAQNLKHRAELMIAIEQRIEGMDAEGGGAATGRISAACERPTHWEDRKIHY